MSMITPLREATGGIGDRQGEVPEAFTFPAQRSSGL